MMKFKFFILVCTLLFMLVSCKQQDSKHSGNYAPAIGQRMQMVQFRMESLTDNTVLESRELADQVLVVTFFASWCPPCIQEIPTFIDLQKSYQDKGFSVVAFSVDEGNLEPLKNLIEKYGINYPVLLADEAVIRGFGGVTGIPVTFLVNRQGEIIKKYLGYVGHEILEPEIKSLMKTG
jgi:thiol-disulfide isomerase/thioredoxin